MCCWFAVDDRFIIQQINGVVVLAYWRWHCVSFAYKAKLVNFMLKIKHCKSIVCFATVYCCFFFSQSTVPKNIFVNNVKSIPRMFTNWNARELQVCIFFHYFTWFQQRSSFKSSNDACFQSIWWIWNINCLVCCSFWDERSIQWMDWIGENRSEKVRVF